MGRNEMFYLWIYRSDIESRTSIRYNIDLYTYCEEEKNTDILPANYCIYLLTATFAVIKYLKHCLLKYGMTSYPLTDKKGYLQIYLHGEY